MIDSVSPYCPLEFSWLIVQKMAANSFGLFVQQISAADDELKVTVIRIIYDLLMVHDIETLVSGTLPVCPSQSCKTQREEELTGVARAVGRSC
jgi:hypothetical protein